MKEIKVYSTHNCPNCLALKELLKKRGLEVQEGDMRTAAVASELFSSNIFAMQAPILRIGTKYYTNMSPGGRLDVALVQSILEKEGV